MLESLILAGAFDSLGYARKALFENQDKVSAPIVAERKAEAAGQFSLFGGGDGPRARSTRPSCRGRSSTKPLLLKQEKEMLGQFVTDHPLLEVRTALAARADMEVPEIVTLDDGDLVTIGGIVGAVARRYTKEGPYAQFRLEDLAGGVTVVAFPSVYDQVPHLIETDAIVLVRTHRSGADAARRSSSARSR